MADIIEWSPVDESNNQPPPNGFPEGMAPSGLNNGSRAIMGAVRRFFDSVNTQISNITASLTNYLPLSGGTLSGSLVAPHFVATGGFWLQSGGVDRVVISYSGSNFVINDAAGQQTIVIAPTGTYYRNGSHTFQDEAGATLAAISAGGTFSSIAGVSTTEIVASGTVSAANVTASGTVSAANVTASGVISAGAYDCDGVRVIDTASSNVLLYKPGSVFGIQLQGIASFYDNNNHYFRNSGGSNTLTIDSAGNVVAASQVQGGHVYSRGNAQVDVNLTVGGSITSGNITAASLYAANGVDGHHVQARGNLTCLGDFTSNDGYSNINAIQPRADHDGFVGRAGLSFDSMSCYDYITVSDARLKRDIEEPEGCLDLVRAVPPRTYRWTDRPDQRQHWGLLAQDFGNFPGRLVDPETGQERLALNQLLTLLWGATRELAARLETLEKTDHAR